MIDTTADTGDYHAWSWRKEVSKYGDKYFWIDLEISVSVTTRQWLDPTN